MAVNESSITIFGYNCPPSNKPDKEWSRVAVSLALVPELSLMNKSHPLKVELS